MAVTSCGVMPETGNLWSVTPALQVFSDDDWGQSVGAFMIPGEDGNSESHCVVKSDAVHRVHLQAGYPSLHQELKIDSGVAMEGAMVAACGTGTGLFFVATSTSRWGGGGNLYGVKLLGNGGWKAFVVIQGGGELGNTVSMAFHDGCIVVFGKESVSLVKSPTRGASHASIEHCGPGHVLEPFEEARACCSEGEFLYVVKPHAIGADELYCVNLERGHGSGTATRVIYQGKGVDPRTIGALVAVSGLEMLPETHILDSYQGEKLDADEVKGVCA